MSSTPTPPIFPIKKRTNFLELPVEIRHMIYDKLLPDKVRLTRRYHFGLAILCTCRKMYEEALQIQKRRRVLILRLEDRDSYLLALWWIKNLGHDLASQINTLEIETWLGCISNQDTAVFRRHRFSFSFGMTGPDNLTIKYTMPDLDSPIVFRYSSECLTEWPLFDWPIQITLFRTFGNGKHTTIDMNLLKEIIQTLARYSKYGYLCLPSAQNIVHVEKPTHHFWSDPCLQRWTYILPASHPDEPVVYSVDSMADGGPLYGTKK